MTIRTKKIIYIFERRHGYVSDGETFGINYYLHKGYEVEVWSAVNWTFQNNISEPLNSDKSGRTILIYNYNDLEREILRVKNEECIFILYPYHQGYGKVSYTIRKAIKRNKMKFCNLTESLDLVEVEEVLPRNFCFILKLYYDALVKKLKKKSKVKVLKQVYNHMNHENRQNKVVTNTSWYAFFGPLLYKSKYNFCVTEAVYRSFPNKFERLSRRNILITHLDYSKYIMLREHNTESLGEYIVFIDEYECGHSDFEKLGIDFAIKDKKEYYKELIHFFDILEEKFSIPVIIAAHPKAEYSGQEFGNRKICWFKTGELIKNAKLILYIYGTSLSYILLFKKPFIHFCTSQHFKGHMVDTLIRGIQQKLDTKILRSYLATYDMNYEEYINIYNEKYDNCISLYLASDNGSKEERYSYMEQFLF